MAEAAAEPPRPETVAADEEAPKAAADKAPATPATSSTVAGDSDDDVKSKRVTLADLSAKGTALYAHKKYEDACDIFSTASILQAEINGETAPENAEILFHYGRSLFKVGQSKSDVLGGPPPAAVAAPTAEVPEKGAASTAAAAQVQKAVEAAAEKEHKEKNDDAAADDAKKPLFQFTGDENFDQPDDEDDAEAAEEEGEEEEEDDLAMAFEILDLARVCYTKQLDQLEQADAADKGKEAAAPSESSAVRHIKERLADTYDCLAEIALENERYVNAIEDGRTSLKHKLELYPEESEIVAEAHYKLSLALEFASVTQTNDEGANTKREAVDRGLRDEAVAEMELAIRSFRRKMALQDVELASMASPEDNEAARRAIAEMREIITDMEQRLVDLRKDPTSARDILGGDDEALGEALRAALGGDGDAASRATDLSGLVRKKAKDGPGPGPANGKREADAGAGSASPKKPRLDEGGAAE